MVLLHTSERQVAVKIIGAVPNLAVFSNRGYLVIQVAAVLVCDTVHQAMITYSGVLTVVHSYRIAYYTLGPQCISM